MTSPGMKDASQFTAGADELIQTMKRRKITWQLMNATVIDNSGNTLQDPTSIAIQLDGDSEVIPAFSLIGSILPGSRVSLLAVPPTGYYIIGYLANTDHTGFVGEQGTPNVTVTAATSTTQVVVFNKSFQSVPVVHANINSGAGATSNWHARCISVAVDGFTIFLFGPSSSFTTGVGWLATEQAT